MYYPDLRGKQFELKALRDFSSENKNDDKTMMDFSIQFDADRYNAAEVYFRGERRLVPLDNGKYSSRLDAGYAEYIMPYKA